MNARLPLLVAALCCPLVLSHCAGGGGGIEITRSSVGKEQLESYSSYAWSSKRTLNLRDPGRNAKAVNGRILRGVNRGLQDKGLEQASRGQADLLVSYTAVSREVEKTSPGGAGFEQPDSPGSEESGTSEPTVIETEEGKLSIEITERRTGKPVYRGDAEATLLEDPATWTADLRLQEAVTRMLVDFPQR